MKLILTDVGQEDLRLTNDMQVIGNNGNIHTCNGCFHCWVKTPGMCSILDGYEDVGIKMSRCTELIIISQCVYGCFSPFIKNVVDRSISYVHPDFCYRDGMLRHKRRYDNKMQVSAYFYGDDVTEAERETACKLINANVMGFDGTIGKIAFLNRKEELREISL